MEINSRPIRIAFLIIGVTVTIVLVVILYFNQSSITPKLTIPFINDSKNNNSENKSDNTGELVSKNTETGEIKYTEEFYSNVAEKNYDELVEKDEDLKDSFGIQDTESRDKYLKEVLNNREPQNHFVIYDGKNLSTSGILILQGDFVTLQNNSVQKFSLIVENVQPESLDADPVVFPSTSPPPISESDNLRYSIGASSQFSIVFDFLGEFRIISDDKKIELSVQVVKSYDDL